MGPFEGKVAIVTGAASGIGREIARGLGRRGARVVVTDLDAAGARAAAEQIPGAEAAELDVTRADRVRDVVEATATRYRHLDYVFNNAGIAIFGEARDMSLADWDRIIDVNVRGVVNGVAAAYPLMVRQGFGHIVNTASAAGLAPTPGGTAYAMTKHAVVGLSTSLRAEATRFGVKVSVVCPGFIDTPIQHNMKLLNVDRDAAMREFPFKLHPADRCAEAILRGVERNRAIIVVTGLARVLWALYRISPSLVLRMVQANTRRNMFLTHRVESKEAR